MIVMRTIAALTLAAACAGPSQAPLAPAEVRVLTRSDWGAQAPVLPMRAHRIERLTIHHTGTSQNFTRTVAQKLLGLQLFSQREDSLASGRRKPAWADVPYHFYVGVDGVVGEGRDWNYAGDTNTEYDPAGHLLVVVEGNFQRDSLTTEQRRTLDRLVPSLARRFSLLPDKLASHRDYAQTECPGANLYSELPRLREIIRAQR